MAEKGVNKSQLREECHSLLIALKSTVEGLLATPSTNVWSTYGGLDRMCKDVSLILSHKLKMLQASDFGSSLDFWWFVRGLRWLNPSLDPVIEQYHKLTRGGGAKRAGEAWLRQSLVEHSLCGQLTILLYHDSHVEQHYEAQSFLRQPDYVSALLTCLRAVEYNRPALLADVNPALLRRAPQSSIHQCPPGRSHHTRSSSLPINQLEEDRMLKRASTNDPLVPSLLTAAKTDTSLATCTVLPTSVGSSPDESAQDTLRQVLHESGGGEDEEGYYSYQSLVYDKLNDPLMNLEIIPTTVPSVGTYVAVVPRRGTLPRSRTLDLKSSQSEETLDSEPSEGRGSGNDRSDSTRPKFKSVHATKSKLKPESVNSSRTKLKSKNANSTRTKLKATDSNSTASEVGEGCRNSRVSETRAEHKNSSKTESSLLLDSILNTDTTPRKSRKSRPNDATFPKSQSHDCGFSSEVHLVHSVNHNDADEGSSQSSRRFGHTRSASDFAIADRHKSATPGGDNVDYSSSLPVHRGSIGFQQPAEGQSLISYLSSQDFHTCADLEKENAHFSISEALIGAIEQMKWNQIIRPMSESDHEDGDSDDEIQELKQRIRIRRRERMTEMNPDFHAFSDGRTDTTASSSSSVSHHNEECSSTCSSKDSSGSNETEFHDTELVDGEDDVGVSGDLRGLHESGLSLSLASLYSDADLQKSSDRTLTSDTIPPLTLTPVLPSGGSAESVAISLLRQFSEKHLPKASDLEWLVSEQDVPQALLPLPDSFPVSPDDNENSDLVRKQTRLRGNLEWAPPRPQIIFNIHPPPKRKVVLAKQNYRCAGCGDKVLQDYIKRYRYCEYLGKYFCPCCHSNDQAYIPGRILRKWDFTKFPVSHFSRDLLARIYNDPLFRIEDINPGLYRRVRALDYMKDWRTQLLCLRKFSRACRLAREVETQVESLPSHWHDDVHVYSLHELLALKKGDLGVHIKQLVNTAVTHVSQCSLCQARGFICEVCRNQADVIFPFELHRVVQCSKCSACFHLNCFSSDKCPKCTRIESRKLKAEIGEQEVIEADGKS